MRDHLTWAAERLDEEVTAQSVTEASVHLRIVLEALMLGTLIVNRDALDRAEKAIRKLKPKDAVKTVAKINGHYWPEPLMTNWTSDGRPYWDELTSGFLRSDEVGRAYGVVSAWVHARHPLRTQLNVAAGHEAIAKIHHRLAILTHVFRLRTVQENLWLICWLDPNTARNLHPKLHGRVLVEVQFGVSPPPGHAPMMRDRGIPGFIEDPLP